MKNENLFRIVMEGQKQFIHFPDGERVALITNTVIVQNTDMATKNIFSATFDFLIDGEVKLTAPCKVDFSETLIIAPSGKAWPVDIVVITQKGSKETASEARAQVWAYYDFENSKP